jgi:hypothetical protein
VRQAASQGRCFLASCDRVRALPEARSLTRGFGCFAFFLPVAKLFLALLKRHRTSPIQKSAVSRVYTSEIPASCTAHRALLERRSMAETAHTHRLGSPTDACVPCKHLRYVAERRGMQTLRHLSHCCVFMGESI